MTDYLAKPFDYTQLQRVIARVILGTGAAAPRSDPAAGAAPAAAAAAEAVAQPQEPVVDAVLDVSVQAVFRGMDADGSTWRQLVGMFDKSLADGLAKIRAGIQQWEQARADVTLAAHSLKVRCRAVRRGLAMLTLAGAQGSSAGMGARKLSAACAAIEKAARRGTACSESELKDLDSQTELAARALHATLEPDRTESPPPGPPDRT
jgi:hypothetical protein